MDQKPHFTALLTFVSEDNGGLKTPVASGYRPLLQFPFHLDQILGILNFANAELAFAGDKVTAEIILLNTEHFKGEIYEGLDFDFFEGPALVGSGIVTKI